MNEISLFIDYSYLCANTLIINTNMKRAIVFFILVSVFIFPILVVDSNLSATSQRAAVGSADHLSKLQNKSKAVVSNQKDSLVTHWLSLKIAPVEGDIYIDDVLVKHTGNYVCKLKPGRYHYRIEARLYHTMVGEFIISDKDINMNTNLLPAYGSISINSDKTTNARVLLDDQMIAESLPFQIEKVISGSHKLLITKEFCKPFSLNLNVLDGNCCKVNPTFISNAAKLNIQSNENATLSINGEAIAVEKWEGNLNAGFYTIESKLDHFYSSQQDIELKVGDLKVVNLTLKPVLATKLVSPNKLESLKEIKPTKSQLRVAMISIKGGAFLLGSDKEDNKLDPQMSSIPQHEVNLSDFKLARTEVTQALWKSVMGTNPCKLQGDSLPVNDVSWLDVQQFITKLNQYTGLNYRLPTEAEWEFAAGGGLYKGTLFPGTNFESEVGEFAWTFENSNGVPHPVATKKPNQLGLYDMSGNVWEWCSDWLGLYPNEKINNPLGPSVGIRRAHRGGCWRGGFCMTNNVRRGGYEPASHNSRIGFRLAMNLN